jgi:hypothetical protein
MTRSEFYAVTALVSCLEICNLIPNKTKNGNCQSFSVTWRERKLLLISRGHSPLMSVRLYSSPLQNTLLSLVLGYTPHLSRTLSSHECPAILLTSPGHSPLMSVRLYSSSLEDTASHECPAILISRGHSASHECPAILLISRGHSASHECPAILLISRGRSASHECPAILIYRGHCLS